MVYRDPNGKSMPVATVGFEGISLGLEKSTHVRRVSANARQFLPGLSITPRYVSDGQQA
jgi:hypothetical protein